MPKNKLRFYWDSCIFLSWLKNETLPSGVMEGILGVVEAVRKGNAVLLTSVVTEQEVLQCKMSPTAEEMFQDFLKRRSIQVISLDRRISKLTRDIRNYYQERVDKEKKEKGITTELPLSLGDAQHLATAIHYEADEFHTTDDGKKSKKYRSILSMDGDVAGHPLKICMPFSNQGVFPWALQPRDAKLSGEVPGDAS